MIKIRCAPPAPPAPPYTVCRGGSVYLCAPLPNPYNRNKLILSFLNKKPTYKHTIHSTPLDTIGGGAGGAGGALVCERFEKVIEPSKPNPLSISFFLPTFSPIIEVVQ